MTLRELFVGRLSLASRLPQYLVLGWSVSVAAVRQRGRDWYGEDRLDDGNVDGRRGARAVDFVRHVGLAIIEARLAGEEGEKREAEITWSGQQGAFLLSDHHIWRGNNHWGPLGVQSPSGPPPKKANALRGTTQGFRSAVTT